MDENTVIDNDGVDQEDYVELEGIYEVCEKLILSNTDQIEIIATEIQKQEMFKDWAGYIGEITNPATTAENPFFKKDGKGSKYAPLDEVLNTTRPILAKYGFGIFQTPTYDKNTVSVKTILTHESGALIGFPTLSIPITKADAQGIISGITYGRRGALNSILGTHGEVDDDGNSVVGNDKKQTVTNTQPKDEPKKDKKDSTSTQPKLSADQAKVLELANSLVASGTNKDVVTKALGTVNPRQTTDAKLLSEAFDRLTKLKPVEKINLKDM